MRKIIDKLSVLICCFIFFTDSGENYIPVLSLLSAMAASCISQYTNNKFISLSAEIFYLLLCIANPHFFSFFPMVMYDILSDKRYKLCAAYGLVFLFNANSFAVWQVLLLSGCTVMSAVLQKRTASLEYAEQNLIKTRDTSAELNMILADSNKRLRENQDYEIHLATLSERNRIAREIHDNVGHLLSRSILQLGAVQLIKDENVRKENLESLSETLNNAMTEIRSSVHDLHDDSIDLKQVISESVKPLTENNITVYTEYDVNGNILNSIKFCMAGIVKEGVSNIIKHSNADSVNIVVREHPAFYQLMIGDNGVCSETFSENGIGLSNMRERVRNLGGFIEISSGRNGFHIFVSLKKTNEVKYENSNS